MRLRALQAALARCASTARSGFPSCRGAELPAVAHWRRFSLAFDIPGQVESSLWIQDASNPPPEVNSKRLPQAKITVYFGRRLSQETATNLFLDKIEDLHGMCADAGTQRATHKDDSRPGLMSFSIYDFTPDTSIQIVHRPLDANQASFDVYMTLSTRH
jgi:hypothetical protein